MALALVLALSGAPDFPAQCAPASAAQSAPPSEAPPMPPPPWTIHVVNDTCPDTTWGFDEKTTRRKQAELVRAHLDVMTRTDGEPEESRRRAGAATRWR